MMIRIIIRVIVVLLPNIKYKKTIFAIWSHTRHFEMATRHRPAMDITRLKGSPRSVYPHISLPCSLFTIPYTYLNHLYEKNRKKTVLEQGSDG